MMLYKYCFIFIFFLSFSCYSVANACRIPLLATNDYKPYINPYGPVEFEVFKEITEAKNCKKVVFIMKKNLQKKII